MFEKSFIVVGVCIGLILCGCYGEGKMAYVSGQVSVDGKLVEKGSISFIPVDGQSPVTGAEILAGKYRSEAPRGESKVEIRVPRKTGSQKLYDTPDSPVQDLFEEVLPAKYHAQTELRFTAQAGNNEKNWELASQ